MYRLTDAFPYLITRVGVRMGELFSRRLESYGVTLPMYRVMAALWQRGNQRLGDLSEGCSERACCREHDHIPTGAPSK
jgi:hypothetical protein